MSYLKVELLPKSVENISVQYRFFITIIALLYSIYLSDFPMEGIKDRINYLNYVENSIYLIIMNFGKGITTLFANEPVWLLINILLSQFFAPEESVRLIIAIPAFVVAYTVLRYNPKYFIFLLLVLMLPQVLKNHVVHLRQGVAISLFIFAWFMQKGKIRLFLLSLTPFIHASFFFILFLLLLNLIASKLRFALDLKTISFTFAGVILAIMSGIVASGLGARQGSGYDGMAEVSGMGFLFWMGILILYFLQGKKYIREYIFAIAILIFYLSSYFLTEVTARIFESGLLIVLLSGLNLTDWRKNFFYFFIFLYFIMTIMPRIGEPYLGYVIG